MKVGQRQRQINYPLALWRRKWLILPFVILGLAGALLAFSRLTPIYRAQATVILIPQSISKSIYPSGWLVGDRLKFIERVIASTSFLDALAAAQGVRESDPDKLRRFARGVSVRKIDRETFVFATVNRDPKLAAEKANLVANIFVEQSQKSKITEVEDSTLFLQDEIARLTTEIDKEKLTLADYQAAHKGELPSDRIAHRSEQLYLRQSLGELKARLETKKKDRAGRQYIVDNPGEPAAVAALEPAADDPRIAQVEEVRKDLRAALLRYTDRHPQVMSLQMNLDALLEDIAINPVVPGNLLPESPPLQVAKGATAPGSRANTPLATFVGLQILRLDQDISELTVESAQILSRIASIQELVQASFLRQNELGRITGRIDLLERKLSGNQSNLQTLETEKEVFARGMDMRYALKAKAGVPLLPFYPDLLQFLLFGLIGGGGIGAGLALLLEVLDKSVWTVEEAEELTGLVVLAVIPNMERERRRAQSGRGKSKRQSGKRKAANA